MDETRLLQRSNLFIINVMDKNALALSQRMPLIDALKAIASQLVLFHHFSSYGPLARAAQEMAPDLMAWLFEYARMSVQVFLVIAGFLAAKGLSPEGNPLKQAPWGLLYKRYTRLIIPFMVAIALSIVCAAIADRWMEDDAIPGRASLLQWLAHATLLHGVLGIDSLSAGVWYVAIDFQLFALFSLLLWLSRRSMIVPVLTIGLAVASLFHFNRDASWDNWAIYFFGAYGLGIVAWWASNKRVLSFWLGLILTVVVAALMVDFRPRIALALATALLLAFSRRTGLLYRWPQDAVLGYLGQISYSVFLVHFPILLVVNALFDAFTQMQPVHVTLGWMVAWGSSLIIASLFYRWVEAPEATKRILTFIQWLTAPLGRLALFPLRRIGLLPGKASGR